jgi:hypothetical protein
MRCEEYDGIDRNFQPFMDVSLRGDCTINPLDDEENPTNTLRKNGKTQEKESYGILHSFLEQGKTLIQHLASAAEEQKAAAEDRKKKLKFHACLKVAKALNDIEQLKKLMEEAKDME